jgi:glutaredoxin
LLNSVDLAYTEKDLSNDDERQNFYKKVGEGVSTVPQIYIEEKRIGGFPQLVAWFEENGY